MRFLTYGGLILIAVFTIIWSQRGQGRSETASVPNESPTITILSAGDVMLGRSVDTHIREFRDATWPFLQVGELLCSADLTWVNLESPVMPKCTPRDDGMVFCAEDTSLQGLVFAGIDVVNFANNHAGNQGRVGVEHTVRKLGEAGVGVAGVDGPVYRTVGQTRIAFLGYNAVDHQPGVAFADPEVIQRQVHEAKKNAELILVAFHWGTEYTTQPSTQQKYLAHLAVDAGADAIIGHHPHWIQSIEMYQDKPIIYSHGNFVFDQMWSEKTRIGIISRLTFSDNTLKNLELIPIKIENYGQPRVMEGDEAKQVLHEVDAANQELLSQ